MWRVGGWCCYGDSGIHRRTGQPSRMTAVSQGLTWEGGLVALGLGAQASVTHLHPLVRQLIKSQRVQNKLGVVFEKEKDRTQRKDFIFVSARVSNRLGHGMEREGMNDVSMSSLLAGVGLMGKSMSMDSGWPEDEFKYSFNEHLLSTCYMHE